MAQIGYLYLLITFTMWGSLYVVAKYALAAFPPVTVATLRCLISVVLLYFLLKVSKRGRKVDREDRKYFLIIGCIGYFFSVTLQLMGTSRLDASLASLINSLNPIVLPVMAVIILKEKLTVKRILSVIIAVTGVYIILGVRSSSLDFLGVLCSLSSVFLWSLSSVLIRKISGKYDPIQISLLGMSAALCLNIPVSLWELSTTDWTFSTTAVLAVIYMAVFCTAVAHTLWNKSLQLLSAGSCSMFYVLQPLNSSILGVVILHEKLSRNFILGAVIIAIGILAAVRSE